MINMNSATHEEIAEYIKELYENKNASEYLQLRKAAIDARTNYYGHHVYLRGLVEFTSYCKNGCYYCGINRGNTNATRFRLTKDDILSAYAKAHELGLRTFVLQGGEDPFYSQQDLCDLIYTLRTTYPDSAITLSIGEKTREEYLAYYQAGADRYLLRHETATASHYQQLHPKDQSYSNRMQCLYHLKEIGYQVGAGFMVDSPFQTYDTLANDYQFLRELQPEMVGIGPFIPTANTPFSTYTPQGIDHTLLLLSLLRNTLPKALIPATTALETSDPKGFVKGLQAGANIIMPSFTPPRMRDSYTIYSEKAHLALEQIKASICEAGCIPQFGRGDHYDFVQK